jgi:hypothetical protein
MIVIELDGAKLDDAQQRHILQGVSMEMMMEEIARRRLEELGQEYSTVK